MSAASQLSPAQQKKYLAGLTGAAREARAREILQRRKKRSDKPFKTDEGRPTKRSKHAVAFERKYGRAPKDTADAARLSHVPKKILDEVYARGMAAWQTGHRPGAGQHAWAMARVESFLTGGPTSKTADADLAREAKLKKRNPPPPFGPPDPRIFAQAGDQFDSIEDLAEAMYPRLDDSLRAQIPLEKWVANAKGLWGFLVEDQEVWGYRFAGRYDWHPYVARNVTNNEASNLAGAFALSLLPKVSKVQAPDTPEFKRWFGKSKVVDAQGKPLAVYHGTGRGGFTKFDLGEIDAHHNGFFFTDSPAMASSYSQGVEDDALYNAPYASPAALLTALESSGDELREGLWFIKRWPYVREIRDTPEKFRAKMIKAMRDAAKSAIDKGISPVVLIPAETFEAGVELGEAYELRVYHDATGIWRQEILVFDPKDDPESAQQLFSKTLGRNKGLYTVFLSLQNPLEIDARGAQWDQISLEAVRSTLSQKQLDEAIANGIPLHLHWGALKTDDVSGAAKFLGYDGVIIRNLVDYGGWVGSNAPADVFIAFKPEQIKSANHNKGTFDPHDADIRNPAPTALNIESLYSLFGGADRVPNQIPASNLPHIRRCLDAGLLTVEDKGKTLVLTAAGIAALAPLRGRKNPAPRVGKLIGGDLYVHKSALHTLPAEVQARVRAAQVPFDWAIVKWNAKAGKLSLIESQDWDTADEPTVGRVFSVDTGKVIQPLADPWIYHHKWQFVEPTYQGFDVEASKARSAAWTALPDVDKSRIGKKSYWEREVLPRLNPSDQTQTPAFKRWFGNSKVIDFNGKPLVVYHGTDKGGFVKFQSALSKAGFFFTDSKDVALTYAGDFDASLMPAAGKHGSGIYAAYLRMEKPLVVDAAGSNWDDIRYQNERWSTDSLAKHAKRSGHDGLIVEDVADAYTTEDLCDVYVVFEPTQIKSATGNKGTFDPHDADIRNPADDTDLWTVMPQTYSSARTSINATRLPATFNRVSWRPGTRNADIGGGRFDNATEYLAGLGVENVIYDPYNRTMEWNEAAAMKIANHQADTVTVNNVLNVIAEEAVRDHVIEQAANALKHNGTAYFLIYTGNESGKGARSQEDAWQNNRKAREYVPEVAEHFGQVQVRDNLIIAQQPLVPNPSHIPPAPVAAAARRGLEMRAAEPPSNRCCTPVGLRRAAQLANRQPVSEDTMRRMLSYFQRHKVDKQGAGWSGSSKGKQAWLCWGGDEGYAWVKRVLGA